MTKLPDTLVILSPGFPANEADSTCIPPQQVFVRNLRKNFPYLRIIVLAFEYPFSTEIYHWNGITVIPFGGQNRGKLFRRANWMRIRLVLYRLNKQHKLIGLLSFWLGDCAFIADTFAKQNDLKHFCWILGQDARPRNKYVKMIKPEAESLIALSDFIADEFNRNYTIRPSHIVPVGIDRSLFGRATAERNIDILGAGSLIGLKQYTLLVELVNSLRDGYPNIKAVICGGGPEATALRRLIKAYQLEDHITLTGELPHSEVLNLMQKTKIFVHPSSYEGFGVVCLEALYAGAKVVSFVKPMNKPIKKWHHVKDTDGMLNVVQSLLQDASPDYSIVLPYLVAETCEKIIQLFDYKADATS